MDPKQQALIIKAVLREQAGKPPRVARSDRVARRRFFSRFKRAMTRLVLAPFPRYRLKLKWRWSRGEIRSRRLFRVWVRKYMSPPIQRFRDYTAIGRKAFIVQELKDGALPIYDDPSSSLPPYLPRES